MTKSMRLEIAAMDPLIGPSPCLACGERFEPEGYSDKFRPELLPDLTAEGLAPAVLVEDRFVGFVCPGCFGEGGEDLARGLRRGAGRLRRMARILEKGGAA
jgi:hypothetical protein